MNISHLGWRWCLVAGMLLVNRTDAAEALPTDAGTPAAKGVSVSGVLFEKQRDDKWQSVPAGVPIRSGILLVSMPRTELVAASGNVRMHLLADVGNRGSFPILETAVVLHDAAGADLDLTFKRGLLVLENIKKSGAATVRMRIGDQTWVLTMQTPATKVGLEIFGRHAPGLPHAGQEKTDVPTNDLLMLVIKGQAFLDTGKEGTAMRAPPGLARMHWDNMQREPTFQRLDKLPNTLTLFLDDQQSAVFKAMCANAATLTQGDLAAGLDRLIESDRKLGRLVGVTLAGAVDEVPRVFRVLMQSSDPATRDQAVLVLRNWLGREPGQINKLETALVARKKLTDVQARSLVQLLVGFNEAERKDPNTYAVLLAYLDHKNQAVRTLAYWHLVRLAPAGKDIPFDPAAPEDQRRRAAQRWHALIPVGQLPPRPMALGS